MPNIYRGTLEPLLQRVSDRSSPVNGFVRELEYRGMSEARARALFGQYISAGMEAELTVSHGICSLVATDTSGAITIDTWEIGVNEILASSLKNPRNIDAISQGELELIARATRDGTDLETAAQTLEADTGDGYSTSLSAAGERLWKRIIAGSDSFFHSQYVLRHTTNVSNRYAANVSDVGVNCIYSQAALFSETQNANLWIYPMPGRLGYKLNQIPVPTVPSNYMWGWLKGASAESTAANNRVNIVTEYKLFTWSTDEYGIF